PGDRHGAQYKRVARRHGWASTAALLRSASSLHSVGMRGWRGRWVSATLPLVVVFACQARPLVPRSDAGFEAGSVSPPIGGDGAAGGGGAGGAGGGGGRRGGGRRRRWRRGWRGWHRWHRWHRWIDRRRGCRWLRLLPPRRRGGRRRALH